MYCHLCTVEFFSKTVPYSHAFSDLVFLILPTKHNYVTSVVPVLSTQAN